jgi:hypothetical protein
LRKAEHSPLPCSPRTTEATFSLQEYVGLYDVSWKLIQDARTNKFAFQQAIQMLDDGLRRRIIRNLNSDLISDGRGALAFLPAADNSSADHGERPPACRSWDGGRRDGDGNDSTKRGDGVTVTGVDTQARTGFPLGQPGRLGDW